MHFVLLPACDLILARLLFQIQSYYDVQKILNFKWYLNLKPIQDQIVREMSYSFWTLNKKNIGISVKENFNLYKWQLLMLPI